MRVQGTQFSFDLGISFLTSPIFRIARNAELQILVVSRPMSVLTQTRIFQWWNDVGNRVPYKLILKGYRYNLPLKASQTPSVAKGHYLFIQNL